MSLGRLRLRAHRGGSVFGALGERIHSVDKAWQAAVLRAHGHAPTWTATGALTAESRHAPQAVDLRFNDLRYEAGCRWLEAGWPIQHVREMLGHANLSQTSTYLHASELGLEESMQRATRRVANPWQSPN